MNTDSDFSHEFELTPAQDCRFIIEERGLSPIMLCQSFEGINQGSEPFKFEIHAFNAEWVLLVRVWPERGKPHMAADMLSRPFWTTWKHMQPFVLIGEKYT